jgi:hypothetical protein
MRLEKTGKAREALAAVTRGAVDLRDRRILILADGQRTRDELAAMLGGDSRLSIDRLVREGFLASPGARAMQVDAPPPRVEPASRSRRSLAAAKMYLLDMLQLQRSLEAADMRLAIQTTSDPEVLVDRLIEALRHLVATTTASYGDRVFQRVAEVLPEDALPRLATVR